MIACGATGVAGLSPMSLCRRAQAKRRSRPYRPSAKVVWRALTPMPAIAARWGDGSPDILALQGRTIRVRGYVRNSNGPSVWVDHPEKIEFIMTPAAPRQQASVKK
jgi:hypothetical protein